MNQSNSNPSDSDTSSSILSAGLKAGALAAALGLGVLFNGAAQAAESPFTHLSGSWSGQGRITPQDGNNERIRCRGNYRAGDATLTISLRCASDSYKFELASEVTYD